MQRAETKFQTDTKFGPFLASTAYHELAFRWDEAIQPIDCYLVCRAQIILGLTRQAERSLDRMEMKLGARHLLCKFIRAQLPTYNSSNAEESLTQFFSLATEEFPTDYLKGEYHFVLGYVHNVLDEYRQGLRHHRLASEHYARAGLRGCEAIAVYNLCVGYNHLAERALFESAFESLKRLSDASDAARLMFERMQVHRLIDAEEYERALDLVSPLLPLSKQLGRSRDFASLASVRAYLLLKTGNYSAFYELMSTLHTEFHSLPQEFSAALAEYSLIANMETFSPQEIRKTMTRWNERKVPSVHRLFLYGLICDKLLKSADFETLGRISHQASQLSIRKQQTLLIVDFRYYEILSLIRTRQLDKAKVLFSLYRSDAETLGLPIRLAKERFLYNELVNAPQGLPASIHSAGSAGGMTLTVDPVGHRVQFGGRLIDLSRKPLITRFLALLIEAAEPVPIAEVFERLYEHAFDPLLHERRFNSIIDRTRAALGDSWAIVRREGRLRINPQISGLVQRGNLQESSAERRRNQLLRAIKDSPTPMTISDLETQFPCCRRTLQLDLKYLIHHNAISHRGRTRDRAYYPAP